MTRSFDGNMINRRLHLLTSSSLGDDAGGANILARRCSRIWENEEKKNRKDARGVHLSPLFPRGETLFFLAHGNDNALIVFAIAT